MKKSFLLLLLLFVTLNVAAQSVADAARANKATKPASKKVITDDDLSAAKPDSASSAADNGDWEADLANMRTVFHEVCADPSSHGGRTLNDDHKKKIDDAVQPLRTHIDGVNDKLKVYREAFDQLNKEEEAAVVATAPKDKPFTDEDKQKVVAIRDQFEAKRKTLQAKSADDLKNYEKVKNEMLATATECPEAAKTVR